MNEATQVVAPSMPDGTWKRTLASATREECKCFDGQGEAVARVEVVVLAREYAIDFTFCSTASRSCTRWQLEARAPRTLDGEIALVVKRDGEALGRAEILDLMPELCECVDYAWPTEFDLGSKGELMWVLEKAKEKFQAGNVVIVS